MVEAVSNLLQANENMQQQLASAERKLEEQAHMIDVHAKDARTDALTQLGNRRAFDIELANCEESFRTSGMPVTLLITDVDRFKLFNDTHSHQAGDEVLRGVSRTMQNSVRAKDIVARYGGEEFAIIFPGTTVEQARTLAEHVRSKIEAEAALKSAVDESRDCIANGDSLSLDCVQPAERIAIIHLAEFFAQLASTQSDPLLDFLGIRHPWLLEFSSFTPSHPTCGQNLPPLPHQRPTPSKMQAAPPGNRCAKPALTRKK